MWLLAIGCRLGGSWANPKNHYILGRSNYLFGADYIEEKNLSQKYGDLRFIEIILNTQTLAKLVMSWRYPNKITESFLTQAVYLRN